MIERYKKMEYTVKQIAELIGVTKPTVQTAIKRSNIQPQRIDSVHRAFYSLNDTTVIIRSIKPTFDLSVLYDFGEKPPNEPQKAPQNKTNDFSVKPPNEKDHNADQEVNRQNEAQKTEKKNRQEENTNAAAADHATDYILNHYIPFLEDQLKAKDQQLAAAHRQIEEKDKQIQELFSRLAQSMDLTKGLQYITAADKMLQANSEAAQRQDQEQQEPQEQEVKTAVKIQDQAEPQQKKKKNNLLHRLFNKS